MDNYFPVSVADFDNIYFTRRPFHRGVTFYYSQGVCSSMGLTRSVGLRFYLGIQAVPIFL